MASTPEQTPTNDVRQQRKSSMHVPGRKEIGDFLVGRVLGEGAYARVFIVRAKDTGKDYAMKVMEKRFIVKEGKSKEVQMERRVLSDVAHPNVVRLFYSFHDKDRLYMVLDLCPGGELAKLIRHHRDLNRKTNNNQYRALTESQTRFYLSETISAVQHLHSLGILHRDLKPENVLIAGNGHVKLTDFGTAKDLNVPSSSAVAGGPQRKDTFCGTAEYVSPEVLQDESAGIGADLWALGVMTHCMLVGKTPFLAESEFLTFQCILTYAGVQDKETEDLLASGDDDQQQQSVLVRKTPETFQFPEGDPMLSPGALDLVKRLLDPRPSKRLGCEAPGELRVHGFFQDIDFTRLDSVTPPPLPYGLEYDAPSMDGAKQDWLVNEDGARDEDDEDVGEEEMLRLQTSPGKLKQAIPAASGSTPRTPTNKVSTPTSSSSRPGSMQRRTSSNQPAGAGLERFLEQDETVMLDGAVSMASFGGFVNARRHMVLTNKGRLLLIDPVTFTCKDEMIAINATVQVRSNGKEFDVQTPKRTIKLKDLLGSAERWKEAIEKV